MIMLFQGTKESYGLQFNKPDELKYTDITHTDHYYDNEFIITVPGNYVDYYTNNPVIINNEVISGVNVTLNSSGNTDITVTTTRLQGYRLNNKGSYITVDVGNPADIYKNIVVLDAGHGGTDPGAQKSGVSEKDINFSIIYEKAEKYFNSPDSTVKAYWTRTTDTFVTLDDRAAFADSVGADLFISLHVNSFNKSSVSGMEIYYSPSNNDTNQAGLSSSILADYFNSQLKGDLNLVNHGQGVKTAKYVVVHKNSVPAILIELGFITNETDLANMTDETFQDNFAKSIFDATTGVFNQYPSGR
jgi:N-acetylmuramoyl-L-alanine amidase